VKILIVDDDLVDQELIKRTLLASDQDISIRIETDVDSALTAIKQSTFDVVLLDYLLPKRNGVEFLLEIKNLHELKKMAIIMLSNSDDEQLGLECIRSGAHDFITKSEINAFRLRRAILAAQARFELEDRLYQSYQNAKNLAEKDNLTGLSNRYIFDESLERIIAKHERNSEIFALILFDLDHFKYVNDTYGHSIGDELLVNIAERIGDNLRADESLFRLGGDEFALLLRNLNSEDGAMQVAKRLLQSVNQTFVLDSISINTSTSIGISIYPFDGNTGQILLKNADIAMYRSKRTGRNNFTFYKEEMQNQFLLEFELEKKMRQAIINKDFTLVYQPILSSDEKLTIGFEALVRWKLDGEFIAPDVFIPIAEKSRLIIDLGQHIITEAIQQLKKINRCSKREYKISINVSPIQLTDTNLVKHIKYCLSKYEVAPYLVEFELTETALFDKSDKTAIVLNQISALGCSIALDDFGTGFSSLSHLQNFPIDTVKIDKSLLPKYDQASHDTRLIKGLVRMLKSLGLEVIAEGVELSEHFDLCNELEIEKLQGYYFSHPLPSDDILKKYK